MPRLRKEEAVAAATIASVLEAEVQQNDDGSQPGMHDLNILRSGDLVGAVEVTSAADGESIALWKLMNGSDERWIIPGIEGGWALSLEPAARAKKLLSELPALLHDLENRGITEIHRHRWRRGAIPFLETRLAALGIAHAQQLGTAFTGSVYITIEQSSEQSGGIVDPTGADTVAWIGQFLSQPQQRDVLDKLARSAASERHAFILLPTFSTAPFGALDLLWRDSNDVVPKTSPALPEPVSHVWLMAFWTQGSGLRWSAGDGWVRFERVFPD